ncbi:MAG: hypothetical protein NTU44_03660 [Bacteroidetes bacterium]|nr:hypothetical protein [Bacteroidota bacterium]
MKTKLVFHLLLVFISFITTFSGYSQSDYYWVGGQSDHNWTNLGNWATSSGGSVHPVILPGSLDNVFFDDNSFLNPTDSEVVIPVSVNFHDMVWSHSNRKVYLTGPGGIWIYGSLTFASANNLMEVRYAGDTRFLSDETETITLGGNWIPGSCFFYGNGSWDFQGDFITTYSINFDKGMINTNNYFISCSRFSSSSVNNIRYLNLGSSTVFVMQENTGPNGYWSSWDVKNPNHNFYLSTDDQSSIHFYGDNVYSVYGSTMHAGEGLKYDRVLFHVGLGKLEVDHDSIYNGDPSDYDVVFDYNGIINKGRNSNGTILYGSNVYIDNIYAGSNDSLYLNNSRVNNINIQQNGVIDGDNNLFYDIYVGSNGMINGKQSQYHDVIINFNGYIGNHSLPPQSRNVNDNVFNDVEIGHQGRIYGNHNVFHDLLFSSHPDWCGYCCTYCGQMQDGELSGNYDTISNNLIFNREGHIYGTRNYANLGEFHADGWVLQGSNAFGNIHFNRNYEECVDCFGKSPHRNILTLESDSTQTITDNLELTGLLQCDHPRVVSNNPGTPAILYSTLPLNLDYVELHDITGQNALSLQDTATRSVDGGGNTNWIFSLGYVPIHIDSIYSDSIHPCGYDLNGKARIFASGGTGTLQYSNTYGSYYCWCTGSDIFGWTNWSENNLFTNQSAGPHGFAVEDYYGCLLQDSPYVIPGPLPITLNAVQAINVSCNGSSDGSLTIMASGGTGTLYYSLNSGPYTTVNQFNNLSPGTYSLSIRDTDGCQLSPAGSWTITQPASLTLSLLGYGLILCAGDSTGHLTATANGGIPPYTYTFKRAVPGGGYPMDSIVTTSNTVLVHSGRYKVKVVDSHGCITESGFPWAQIYEPMRFRINFTVGSSNCNGSYWVKANATGGTPGFPPNDYSFQWSNGSFGSGNWDTINNLLPGSYRVTISDDYSCNYDSLVVITGLSGIIDHSDVHCNGGNDGWAAVRGEGGSAPYAYLWSNGVSFSTGINPNLSAGTYYVTIMDFNGCNYPDSVVITEPPVFSISFQTTPTTCYGSSGGTATVIPGGGTPPYTYHWSIGNYTGQTITGLVADTYAVTVTDADGCKQYGSVSLPQPPLLTLSLDGQGPTFFGGSNGFINATINGGSEPYSFHWNTGEQTQNLSGLTAGCYSLTVTDAGNCSTSATKCLTQPGVLMVILQETQVRCYGSNTGKVKAIVSGGIAPYKYTWNTGHVVYSSGYDTLNNLAAGSYCVTITDNNGNGISINECTSIFEPDALTAGIQTTPVYCYGSPGGSAIVFAGGGTPPYSFHWNTGSNSPMITNLMPGIYFVTVTDSYACSTFSTDTITSPPPFTVSFLSGNSNCTNTGNWIKATANGGTPPYTYSWNQGFVTDSIYGLSPGNYSVTVHDADGCLVTGNQQIDGSGIPAGVSGYITYDNAASTGLGNVTVKIKHNNDLIGTTSSGAGGYYSFNCLESGSYQLEIQCNKTFGGINTTDALLALKHFAGLSFLQGIREKAAHVKGPGIINSTDALLIMKRFVYPQTTFIVGDWVFDNPVITLSPSSLITQDIKGLCYGDLNASYSPVARISSDVSILEQEELPVIAGDNINIEIRTLQEMDLGAISLVMEIPSGVKIKKIDMISGQIRTRENEELLYQVVNNILRLSWVSITPVHLVKDEMLMTLSVEIDNLAVGNWKVPDNGETELADPNGVIIPEIRLQIPKLVTSDRGIIIGKISPNPLTLHSSVKLNLPEASYLEISLLNMVGQEIRRITCEDLEAGFHQINIPYQDLVAGMYLCKVTIRNGNSLVVNTQKIISGADQ